NLDASIAELTPQQFNARYPLPIKRQIAREEGRYRAPRRQRRAEAARVAPPDNTRKLSPFLEDREHRGDDINGKGKARKSQSGTGLNLANGINRPNATRRRIAQARAEGPTLEFDDAALRSTLLRLMRDVAEAAGT